MELPPTAAPARVAIIGGGITGLAAAHRVHELAPTAKVTLFEETGRAGGVLETVREGAYLIERSADMFSTKDPWALDLCRRIGLQEQLISTNESHRRAFVVHRGRLEPVPEGFTLMSPARTWPVLATKLLSWRAKARLAGERFVPPRTDQADESLETFATRRLGREVYEKLVQPLIGGIYTADPKRLSMQAALPEFVRLEREYGSLTRGVRRQTQRQTGSGTGARYGLFVAPREGMGQLVEALVTRLPTVDWRLRTRVEQVRRLDNRWQVTTGGGSLPQDFDALLIATPAFHAARLLTEVGPELSSELRSIVYASAAIVVLGYRRQQIEHALHGFGFVVPAVEQRQILSASFASIKFPGRAPEDRVLLRVFIGGACQPELVELPNEQLCEIAQRELAELLGARGEPELRQLIRWRNAMPQYSLGHLQRVARITELANQLPRLALAGSAYRGVGLPFCIHSGEVAAEHAVGSW